MTFGEIYGHGKQIAILKSAMAKDRIAHAYLFYGMEGIGKRTTAAVFARALNCGAEDPSLRHLPVLPKSGAQKPSRHRHDYGRRPVHQDRGG